MADASLMLIALVKNNLTTCHLEAKGWPGRHAAQAVFPQILRQDLAAHYNCITLQETNKKFMY